MCPKSPGKKTKRIRRFLLVVFFFLVFFLNITCGVFFEPRCSIWGCDPDVFHPCGFKGFCWEKVERERKSNGEFLYSNYFDRIIMGI